MGQKHFGCAISIQTLKRLKILSEDLKFTGLKNLFEMDKVRINGC